MPMRGCGMRSTVPAGRTPPRLDQSGASRGTVRRRMIDARLELADWRRQVSELYAAIRANADPEQAWRHWRDERDRLYRSHPQSPIPAAERGDATAPEYYEYDPTLRTVADVEAADGATFDLPGPAGGPRH